MMKKLIRQIFESYNFDLKLNDNNIEFYSSKDERVNFFLIDYIDATGDKLTENALLELLKRLELEYINDYDEDKKSLKSKIQEIYTDESTIAAQIDKNTSALYAVKFDSLNELDKYRNIIYSVEESPYYFRRFILPYTDSQVSKLNNKIVEYSDNNIVSVLNKIVSNQDDYYNLSMHKNLENEYELAIRLFSKIPFLQYSFHAVQKPLLPKKRVENELNEKQVKYHKLICNRCMDIDEYIRISDFEIEESSIDKEFQKRLGM